MMTQLTLCVSIQQYMSYLQRWMLRTDSLHKDAEQAVCINSLDQQRINLEISCSRQLRGMS
jgi:hypothetical protein